MKTKISLVLLLLSIFGTQLKSQSEEAYLKSSYDKFNAAKSEPEMIAASSQLDMTINKWPNTWQSYFYAAYAKIKVSLKLTEQSKRDLYLDAADNYLERASKLSENNAEIYIMKAWSAKARIAVDGKDRWKKFGEVYDGYINVAKKLKPENPRIFFLEGQSPFYKPKMFGGGKDKAKPYFEKAKSLLDQEDKSNIMVPYWGEQEVEEYLKQCHE